MSVSKDEARQLDVARDVIRAWVACHPEIMRVYIYGSRVRGCTKDGDPVRPDSDLDVAIELAGEDEEDAFQQFMDVSTEMKQQLKQLLQWPLDLDWYHPTGSPNVYRYVNQCGEVVYPLPRDITPKL